MNTTKNLASVALLAKAGLCALASWLASRQAFGIAGQPDIGLLSFGFFLLALLATVGLLLYGVSAGLVRMRNRGVRVLASAIDIAATMAFVGLIIWLAMLVSVEPDGSLNAYLGPWPLTLALITSLGLVAGTLAVIRATR